MPEIIDQAEIKLPWNKINLKEILWTSPLQGTGLTLAAHTLKGSKAILVVAYEGRVGDPATAVAGMALSSPSGRSTVWGIQVAKKARGQQIALNMYITLAERGFTLISDDTQTQGGSALWRALDRKFPGCVRVLGDDGQPDGEMDKHPSNAFTDPFSQLVFSLDNRTDIKKSA